MVAFGAWFPPWPNPHARTRTEHAATNVAHKSWRTRASAIKKRPPIKTRFGWLTVILPIIGPIFAGGVRAPTFDDVEKMLQLFGLVSALILSVVADAASYDDLNPNSKTIQGRAYSAFGFCVASVIHVLIVYIYLITCVDQEESESGKADIQMQKFWYLGKLNMVLQVGFIVMALVEYITYVNSTLLDGYDGDGWDPSGIEHYGDNYFGFFVRKS